MSLGVVFVAVMIVVVSALSIIRMRRGGPGPVVNWVPRSMRPWLNQYYEKQGWQKPYDENGHKIQRC